MCIGGKSSVIRGIDLRKMHHKVTLYLGTNGVHSYCYLVTLLENPGSYLILAMWKGPGICFDWSAVELPNEGCFGAILLTFVLCLQRGCSFIMLFLYVRQGRSHQPMASSIVAGKQFGGQRSCLIWF